MAESKQQKEEAANEEAKKDLQADRDDALGYSREQFTFEKENSKETQKPSPEEPGDKE
ncbi:MAG: hypothetical protein WEA61_08565 [Anaerolineales bacterium]